MPTVTTLASHTKWDEDRSIKITPRVTPAHVAFAAPEIDGTIQTEYIMAYLPDGNAEFIFTETVEAKNFQGKAGSFISQGKGSFDATSYSVSGGFTIVKGSGTGELRGIEGTGSYATAAKGSPQIKYEYIVEGI